MQFKEKPSQEKLQLKDDLYNGIMQTLDKSMVGDHIDGDLYTLFKVAGMWVTSLVLGSDKRRYERIVRLKHLEFLPSRQDRQRVFLLLPSTKTRSVANLERQLFFFLKKNISFFCCTCELHDFLKFEWRL